MNNIFELISGNIFYVIILLWIISSLFSRGKGNQEEQQQKRPVPRQGNTQRPTQGQRTPQRTERPQQAQTTARQPRTAQVGDKPWERVETKVETEADRLRKAEQERERRQRMEQQQRRKEARPSFTEQETVHDSAISDQIGKGSEGGGDAYSERAKALLDFSRLNAQNATQGMVWSQIFGMPRAKDPHRSNRYTNFKTKY